jgi:hypothetical protein
MLYNLAPTRSVHPLAVLPVFAAIILLVIAIGAGLGLDVTQTFTIAPTADSEDVAALVRLGDAERALRANLVATRASGNGDAALRRAEDALEALALSEQYHERVLSHQRRLEAGLHLLYPLAIALGVLAIIAIVWYRRRVNLQLIEPVELLGHVMAVSRADGELSRRAPEFGHAAIAATVREFNALMEQLQVDCAGRCRLARADDGGDADIPLAVSDTISTMQTQINPETIAQFRADVRAASAPQDPAGRLEP